VLGPPVQLAYAVGDVRDAAEQRAAATGAGPFFVLEHIPLADVRLHGEPSEFDHSSAYGQWGSFMVELVVEHSPALVEPGHLHHLAFMVASLPDAEAWCVDAGWPELLWAKTSAGQEFAFMDARAELGHLIELYQPSPRLLDFYAMVADAAIDWDGREPVRREL
jgi:catechol 2,3-dioxygenase-like lactoylglutathione lyase family enzyme